ncbi:type II toxin-antitoxin system HicB family antitoxin [Halobaculum roseum]|uniref:Type II toxin-antitoxin system HicB family antitoxin n=1 Tax=Halobaculum roseum TaxID=2175149 RepID=A0ABD5MIU4_9EURY|nr:type II toxin-antitoxin system HicB family antitoxin [Halobaculum roseum]QZY04215.1 type II toxin-antitoxin system HicB family antitoxin [Halobaculum roseum]
MSTDTVGNGEPPLPERISLTPAEDGDGWVARDEDTGIASQGPTRAVALENLDEAVAGYYGGGTEPTPEDLAELGIDPDANSSGSLSDSDLFE